MADEKVQIEPRPDDVPDNTPEQDQFIKEQEERWELERSWPLWEVALEGDETEWRARPGVNLDDDGNPQPWRAPHTARVQCRAPSADFAKALALRDNPACHTVTDAKQIEG